MRTTAFLFIAFAAAASNAIATDMTRHVSARVPVQGEARELAVEHATRLPSRSPAPIAHGTQHTWQLQQTLPGAVVHDIAFSSASVGYAAAELGQVWKTTDGGAHWDRIVNLGFPY